MRSLLYYLHSIREEELFPSSICTSVDTCNLEMVEDDTVTAYMGEKAMQGYQGWVIRVIGFVFYMIIIFTEGGSCSTMMCMTVTGLMKNITGSSVCKG